MNIPAFCIRRPAFTIVISLIMTLVGLIAFMNLPVRWIPNINFPAITIITTYPGANARLVEHDISKVLEDALSGINGIENLTSTTRQGQSQITLTFKLGRNMDVAIEDVRTAVERVRNTLPKDAETPLVLKANTDNMPVVVVSLYDKQRSIRDLGDYIDQYIAPSLETVDGVGNVDIYGKRISALHIRLDPTKMAAAKVTVDEVTQLLREQNVSIPSGQIRGNDRFYSVVTDTTLKTPEQFNNLIIRDQQNQVIRLKDIGEAILDAENTDSAFRFNGKPAIALGIIPQSTANPLEVEKNIQRVLKHFKQTLPRGMQLNIVYNQTDYIRASMQSVYEAFGEAVIFVWLVILAFLCNFRATFVPIITIPVCIISTFALLFVFGFSLNTITLMAFVLAIGLVVDDAIVMLENINRHIEAGMKPFAAALQGSREMIFPIIAMTLTLAAVYAPIALTPGLIGILFREFTVTLAGAVIISGIVALTLSPMMCARILKPQHHLPRYQIWLTQFLTRIQNHYQRVLQYLLRKRIWVVSGLLCIGLMGLALYHYLPAELAATEDMDQIEVYIGAPHSASFQYSDQYVRQLETLYANNPNVESYLSEIGGNSPARSYQMIKLKPAAQRHDTTEKIIQDLSGQTSQIPGVRVNVTAPSSPLANMTSSDEGNKISLVIMTSSDYLRLQQVSEKMVEALKQIPGIINVQHQLKWDSEQFQVNINRNLAADLKVSIPNISNTISTLLAGKTIGKTGEANVIVQMKESALSNPNIFQDLYVRNENGFMVPLVHLVDIQEVTAPEVLRHYDRMRADTINISIAPNFKLSEAIQTLQNVARDFLPEDMKFTFTGEAKNFLESSGKTMFTFLLALIFIYLVLVAQFESFIDPFIIMLTVPFAVVGALLTLMLFGGSLNIYSNIGLITLVGLIAKHGILITEFANRLRMEGQSIQTAVVSACLLRLRPILMTTAAMVLGALPLAFAFGPGAESRQQIGLVITGGLLFGTFFSLIVVPITYTYLAPFRKLTLTPPDQEENDVVIL